MKILQKKVGTLLVDDGGDTDLRNNEGVNIVKEETITNKRIDGERRGRTIQVDTPSTPTVKGRVKGVWNGNDSSNETLEVDGNLLPKKTFQ